MLMKTKTYKLSTEYRTLAEEVIKEVESLNWLENVRIEYLESQEDKTHNDKKVGGECIKVEDIYKTFIPLDFIIVVYAPNVARMTREQRKQLMHHELLHIGFNNTKEGRVFKIVHHDIEDFREIIELYGLDWAR